MIRALIVMAMVLGAYALVTNADAPSAQQEAEDVSSDARAAELAARRQAREERREQWLAAEMKRRGCMK